MPLSRGRYVPPLGWVERAQRQAKKHLAAAEPLPLSQLLWAWGEWGYSPRDKPLVNEIKGALRRMLARRDLTADQMVMVMHGVARLDPEYWPNPRWMAVFVARTWPHLAAMAPGGMAWECGQGAAVEGAVRGLWRSCGRAVAAILPGCLTAQGACG